MASKIALRGAVWIWLQNWGTSLGGIKAGLAGCNLILVGISPSLMTGLGTAIAEPTWLVLYDGAFKGGDVPPEQQGWLAFGGQASTASRFSQAGSTQLKTQRATIAGYSNYQFQQPTLVNPAFPELDRTTGYTVRFEVKINQETHSGSDKNRDGIGDRAGFSVIVISNDQKGIELGFWKDDPNPNITNRIWAQQDGLVPPPKGKLFTHTAEGVSFRTEDLTRYELKVKGNYYQLRVNGSTQPILKGSLRDYTSFDYKANKPPLPFNPYATPNFLFFGDDTGLASAEIELKSIAINKLPISKG
jgi:hypothetical protein